MHLESHESADDRQYYDYHMDRNGHSLHGDEQDLTSNKMKEQKLPIAEDILEEHNLINVYGEVRCAKSDVIEAIESHTQAHTAALRERVKELEVKQSTITSAMHESLTQLIQCDYVKANMLIYDALKITDEL